MSGIYGFVMLWTCLFESGYATEHTKLNNSTGIELEQKFNRNQPSIVDYTLTEHRCVILKQCDTPLNVPIQVQWTLSGSDMERIVYTRDQLTALKQTTATPCIDSIAHINELCTNRKYPHRRGRRAGKRVRKCIPVRTSDRKPFQPSGKGINHSNLVNVETIKWDLPVFSFTNIYGGHVDKLDEIKLLCQDHFIDIFGIVETWLTTKVPDQCLSLHGYTTYRRDRKDGRVHGGVCCYVKENLPVTKVWEELDKQDLEILWITIRPHHLPRDFTHITIGVVYHPPGSDDRTMSEHIIHCVDYILQQYPNSDIIICGDFNRMKDTYLKSACQLRQIVKRPTRKKAILDMCYTNMHNMYSTPQHEPPVGLSDHQVVICKPTMSKYNPAQKLKFMKRVQGPNERAMFSLALRKIRWEPLYMLETCQEQYQYFQATIDNLMNTHLPMKTVTRNTNDRPWINDRFRELIKLRQLHHHQGNEIQYRYYRNKVNRVRKQLQKKHYENKMQKLKESNPKDWWKHIKEITRNTKEHNNLQPLANSICGGDLNALANQINATFKSVSDDLVPLSRHDTFTIGTDCTQPDEYIITVQQVEDQLAAINTNKAVGPDGIPNWILRDFAPILAPPVCALFNSSFREGYVPSLWKSADVCPLPKVTPPTRLDKHLRPISLTPIVSKAAEFYVRDWVMDLVADVLDPHQFGSLKGSSTVHALVELIHQWHTALDVPGKAVRVLLLDFRKAFDLVDHRILLQKLANTGIPNFLLRWIASFLTERKQRVKMGSTMSEWVQIYGGVPQGTLLGPTGFLVHINDLQTVCNTCKYVDDSSVWEVCEYGGRDSNLQIATDQAVEWAKKNNMKLNSDKTKEMLIYFGKKPHNLTAITIDGSAIRQVNSATLLGIKLSDNLSWDEHVHSICSKASQRLYFLCLLRRAGKKPEDILTVYTSVIRSVLEYACEVWHTHLTVEQSNDIECIQKRALSIAYPDLSYSEALEQCDIETLKGRREHMCKKFFYKMQDSTHRLNYMLPQERTVTKALRSFHKYPLPKVRTNRCKNTLVNYGLFNFQ